MGFASFVVSRFWSGSNFGFGDSHGLVDERTSVLMLEMCFLFYCDGVLSGSVWDDGNGEKIVEFDCVWSGLIEIRGGVLVQFRNLNFLFDSGKRAFWANRVLLVVFSLVHYLVRKLVPEKCQKKKTLYF